MEKQGINPKYQALAIIGVLALGALFLFWPKPLHQLRQGEVYLEVGEYGYKTVVARTSEERAKGLSDREALCVDCAMLFVFDTPGQYGFWMKGMRFPLDILWIYDGQVVHKESNVSEKRTDVIEPDVEAEMVLEINPNPKIRVGDKVQIEGK
jgi:uncharacterized membrane protein (UPF0127 family)